MKRAVRIYILLFPVLFLTGCDQDTMTIFAGKAPSVDTRFEQSMVYNNQFGYTTLTVRDDEYRIYVCTDTHILHQTTTLEKFIQLYHDDRDCPAAVHLGDLVESDETYGRFVMAQNAVPANPGKKDSLFVTLGNHDIFYSQWEEYTRYWPTSVYYFVVQSQGKTKAKDLYICLDSAQGKIGYKQLKWLEWLLASSQEEYRYIIVFSHVNLFRRDNTSADISTTAIEETYELMWLFTKYGVKQFWSGHDHSREEFTEGGVKYIIVDSMLEDDEDAAYMILHVGSQLNNTFHFINEE